MEGQKIPADNEKNVRSISASDAIKSAILEAALDGIITMDHEGRVIEFNPAAEHMFGYRKSDAVGKLLADLVIPPRLREQHRHGLAKYIATGEAKVLGKRLEMMAIRADGTEFPVEISIVRISSNGTPLFTGYIRDLTTQRQAELARQTSEQLLRLFIQHAPVSIAMFDRNMNYIAVSERWMSDYNLGSRNIIGRSHYEIFPDIPERWKEVHRRGLNNEIIREDNDRFVRSDSDVQWLSWEVRPWHTPDGNVGGIVMFTQEVTDRKRTEERLRFQAQLLDSVRESVVATDLDSNILYWGRGAEELYGYTAEEVMNKPYWHYAGSLEMSENEAFKNQILENGSWRGEKMQKRRDGTAFWSSVLVSLVKDDEGKPYGFIGIDHDITDRLHREEERWQMEQRLQQTQRLESLGLLSGGIAHDFNNILTAILGQSELVLEELPPSSPARENIAKIKTSSIRAADLCSQLLAYTGKGLFETQDISLGSLIEEILHMLKTSISKKCTLNLYLSKNMPQMHGDPSQIRQILMNLIINASDAIGEDNGVITISTGAMNCSAEYLSNSYTINPCEPGKYVYIEVTDTGCGMNKLTLQRIFDPFFTTKFAGRGLGLSVVAGIVRAHKGSLKLTSEVGRGTTFRVLFPAIEPVVRDEADQSGSRATNWHGKGTILIADDEEAIRNILSALLQRLGFNTIAAEDGQQAVDIYRMKQSEITLVLMDLTMPRMNGAEAFTELRKINPNICVVITSGYSEIDITSRFAGKGIGGFLQKPYTFTRLRELLSSLLPADNA